MSARTTGVLLAILAFATATGSVDARAQQTQSSEELARQPKTKVQPSYPDLARKMNITGAVKVAVIVAPSGAIKEARVVGGHPVLANAALEAAKKWRFEPASVESTGIIEFKFEPR